MEKLRVSSTVNLHARFTGGAMRLSIPKPLEFFDICDILYVLSYVDSVKASNFYPTV